MELCTSFSLNEWIIREGNNLIQSKCNIWNFPSGVETTSVIFQHNRKSRIMNFNMNEVEGSTPQTPIEVYPASNFAF